MAFMADIAAEWVGAGENGEFAMPDSYSRLFERRVKQLAALNNIEPTDEAMAKVIEKATDLAETGEIAFLRLADDDDEIPDEPDPEPQPAPRRRQPKAETPEPVVPPQPDVPVPTEPMPEIPQVEASEPQEATQPPDDWEVPPSQPLDEDLEARIEAERKDEVDSEGRRIIGEMDLPTKVYDVEIESGGLTVFNELMGRLQ